MSLCSAALIFILLIFAAAFICALMHSRKCRPAYILSLVLLAVAAMYMLFCLFTGVRDFYISYLEYQEANKELTISEVPFDEPEAYIPPVPLQPDVLGIRNTVFEPVPSLDSINRISEYVLYNLLYERWAFECFIPRELAAEEGQGHFLFADACANAMSYYFFSSGNIFYMYTEDRGDEQGIWSSLSLEFSNTDYDTMAKNEALRFVQDNPPPEGGFQDFESERAYALMIHDYLGKKLVYSQIGYDPLLLKNEDRYAAKQEAYNALCETDNSAVCAAYARGFALIAQNAGIDCAFVQGNDQGEESHAWNVIFPCDGSEPVIVDITWDDLPSMDGPEQQEISHSYFYLPMSADYEHYSRDGMREFINYLHLINGDGRQLSH